jgi:hypothetical protein
MDNPYLQDIFKRLEKVSQEAEENFGTLNEAQLNWQPGPERWSIAQCLDHLIFTNCAYYPQFEAIAAGVKRRSFWESVPGWAALWGKLMLRSITPEPRQKLKMPPAFDPGRSHVPATIIADFLAHNKEFIQRLSALDKVSHRRVIITSPAAAAIPYSLEAACKVLANHEERHLRQAKKVMELEEFPLFE